MDSELKLRKVKLQLHHRKSEAKQPRLGRACKKENSGPEGRPDRHQHINTESEQEPYSMISKGTQIVGSISPVNHITFFYKSC